MKLRKLNLKFKTKLENGEIMKNIYIKFLLLLLAIILYFAELNASGNNFNNNGNSRGIGNTIFRAHVCEDPITIRVENGNIDLGRITPGSTKDFTLGDWDNTGVMDINFSKGYKILIKGELDHYSSPRSGLKIDYKYKLQNRNFWIEPNSDYWQINNLTNNDVKFGELRLLVSVYKMTADVGAKVGERVFKLTVTAEYCD